MKKLLLIIVVLFYTVSVFSEMKYKPNVVVIFMGEKNPSFDESKYPDLKFYYTPDITLKSSSADDYKYGGSPQELVKLDVDRGTYFFDKDAVFIGNLYGVSADGIEKNSVFVTHKRKTVVTDGNYYELITVGDLAKNYIKKGKSTKSVKNAKIKKKDNPDSFRFLHGKKWPDFNVQDASGKEVAFSSLFENEPLTMVKILYLNKDYDLNKGKESGAGKSGKEYAVDVLKTVMGDGMISSLSDIEAQVFGYRVPR
jgi:hypothetical protein